MRQFPRYILKKYLGPRGRGGTSGYKPRSPAAAKKNDKHQKVPPINITGRKINVSFAYRVEGKFLAQLAGP